MPQVPGRSPSLVGLLDDSPDGRPLVALIDDVLDAQHELEQQLRRRFGTNNTDFRALLFIYRRQRRRRAARSADLARALGVTSGGVAQIVGRLVSGGHVARVDDPADARAGLLRLTEQASAQLADVTAGLRANIDEMLADVSARDEAVILDLLERLLVIYRGHEFAHETDGLVPQQH